MYNKDWGYSLATCGENIDIELIELDKVLDMINQNIIKDAKTICLIQKYLFRNKLL